MDELLTPLRTTYLRRTQDDEALLTEARPAAKAQEISKFSRVESAEDALSILKGQPDYDSLIAVLRFLTDKETSSDFGIHVPSPKSAAVIHVLVSEIIPNYWTLLQEGSSMEETKSSTASTPTDAARLVTSLRSVAGVNAVVGHIKALIQESTPTKRDGNGPDVKLHLGIFMDVLSALLDGNDSIPAIWSASTAGSADAASKKIQSHSLISLMASGRILSSCAQASELIGKDETPTRVRTLLDGVEYCKWIGRNVATWAKLQPEADELQACFDLFQRAMSLGYSGGTLVFT
jgi:telomere length regulation protein